MADVPGGAGGGILVEKLCCQQTNASIELDSRVVELVASDRVASGGISQKGRIMGTEMSNIVVCTSAESRGVVASDGGIGGKCQMTYATKDEEDGNHDSLGSRREKDWTGLKAEGRGGKLHARGWQKCERHST